MKDTLIINTATGVATLAATTEKTFQFKNLALGKISLTFFCTKCNAVQSFKVKDYYIKFVS